MEAKVQRPPPPPDAEKEVDEIYIAVPSCPVDRDSRVEDARRRGQKSDHMETAAAAWWWPGLGAGAVAMPSGSPAQG